MEAANALLRRCEGLDYAVEVGPGVDGEFEDPSYIWAAPPDNLNAIIHQDSRNCWSMKETPSVVSTRPAALI